MRSCRRDPRVLGGRSIGSGYGNEGEIDMRCCENLDEDSFGVDSCVLYSLIPLVRPEMFVNEDC